MNPWPVPGDRFKGVQALVLSLIIYPRQRPGTLVSPAGHVVDHLALAVSD